MQNVFLVCVLWLAGVSFASIGAGEPPSKGDGDKPHGSVYPTAHDPHYADRRCWSAEVLKSYHAQEKWPKGRQWTWAQPGSSMGARQHPLEPANWLEDGKPATAAWDENTDLDFPDADKAYYVSMEGAKSPVTWRRHLTVGRNAHIDWLHGAKGNTWIKDGGRLTVLTFIGGDKHAFLRNDNKEAWWMVDHMFCDKSPKASIEILGPFSVDDSYHFNSGMTILGEDSLLTPQARSNLNIQPNATLAILSGATYRKQANQTFAADLIVRGRLLGGLPERPLTRDATLGLSWKGKRRFLGGENKGFRAENPDDVAFIVMPAFTAYEYQDDKGWVPVSSPGGSLQVHTTDAAKARLVLNWNGLEVSGEARKGGPADQENYEKLSAVKDHFIEVMLLGDINPEGLFIDHLLKGGLIVADPAAPIWRKVTLGTHCEVQTKDLFKKWDEKPQSLFKSKGDF